MCLLAGIIAYFLIILFLITFLFPMPINDSGVLRYRTVPWGTLMLIVINTLIFVLWISPSLYQHQDGMLVARDSFDEYATKMYTYGYSEWALKRGYGIGAFSTFSSMFMHAHFWHLFGNMVYLWTFGRRVEDACGTWRFLTFYLTSGMVAHVGAALLNPGVDAIPSVGASGAIAGVMGAYMVLFYNSSVDVLWGLGGLIRLPFAALRMVWNRDASFWRWTISLPAWTLLGFFLFQNMVPSLETIQGDAELQGVNYLAHLAGFFAGLTVFLFARKDLVLRYASGRSL